MSKVDYVDCPICGESDMRMTNSNEGDEPAIHCVNHACASNGGENYDALAQRLRRSLKLLPKDKPEPSTVVTRRVRDDFDALRLLTAIVKCGGKPLSVVYEADPRFDLKFHVFALVHDIHEVYVTYDKTFVTTKG